MTIQINHQTFMIKICKTFISRCIGMMGKKKTSSTGLYFPKCNSLHTFFMKQNIDIIMVNKKAQIVAFYQNVKPWHIVYCKKAVACYEFSTGILTTIMVGDTVLHTEL